jgi:hypothetical protein
MHVFRKEEISKFEDVHKVVVVFAPPPTNGRSSAITALHDIFFRPL